MKLEHNPCLWKCLWYRQEARDTQLSAHIQRSSPWIERVLGCECAQLGSAPAPEPDLLSGCEYIIVPQFELDLCFSNAMFATRGFGRRALGDTTEKEGQWLGKFSYPNPVLVTVV